MGKEKLHLTFPLKSLSTCHFSVSGISVFITKCAQYQNNELRVPQYYKPHNTIPNNLSSPACEEREPASLLMPLSHSLSKWNNPTRASPLLQQYRRESLQSKTWERLLPHYHCCPKYSTFTVVIVITH